MHSQHNVDEIGTGVRWDRLCGSIYRYILEHESNILLVVDTIAVLDRLPDTQTRTLSATLTTLSRLPTATDDHPFVIEVQT